MLALLHWRHTSFGLFHARSDWKRHFKWTYVLDEIDFHSPSPSFFFSVVLKEIDTQQVEIATSLFDIIFYSFM